MHVAAAAVLWSLLGALGVLVMVVVSICIAHYSCAHPLVPVWDNNIGNSLVLYGVAMNNAFTRGRNLEAWFLPVWKGYRSPVLSFDRTVPLEGSGFVPRLGLAKEPIVNLVEFNSMPDPRHWNAVRVPLRRQIDKHWEPLGATESERAGRALVLHFRCSDVPFERHSHYELPMYRWWRAAIREAMRVGDVDCCDVMWCFSHRACGANSEAARAYFDDLLRMVRAFLAREYDISDVQHRCGASVVGDFQYLRGARAIVSGQSSFSWMAGVTGTQKRVAFMANRDRARWVPGKWPAHMVELERDLLPHAEVEDYRDWRRVVGQLEGSCGSNQNPSRRSSR